MCIAKLAAIIRLTAIDDRVVIKNELYFLSVACFGSNFLYRLSLFINSSKKTLEQSPFFSHKTQQCLLIKDTRTNTGYNRNVPFEK